MEQFNEELAAAIPGVAIKNWHEAPDFASLAAVMNASLLADGIEHSISPDEMENWFSEYSTFSPTSDGFVAEVNGETIGWTRVLCHQEAAGSTILRHGEIVHSKWRDRGLGAALRDLAEARGKEIIPGCLLERKPTASSTSRKAPRL
jgi:GNAT superfamily N-acetyltransferase